MNNENTFFFDRNMLVLSELSRFAPSNDKLLSIPHHVDCTDPFLLFCMRTDDLNKNNYLIGSNLILFSQYVNQTLSRVYAASKFILENRGKQKSQNLNQSETNFQIYLDACILHEYQYSIREFISMLKVIVDQLIMLLSLSFKNGKNCDCIQEFLKIIDESKYGCWNNDKKFLAGLNIAANYLKHHLYQFEGPAMRLDLNPVSLFVVVKNNEKSKDCCDLKTFFSDQFQCLNDNYLSCLIRCEFLVSGFNEFYKKFR